MKQTVTWDTFRQAFRTLRPENFSYAGISALWDYFENYEEDTGEELELDVVAICCDFAESTFEEIAGDYSIEPRDGEELEDAVRRRLEEEGAFVGEGEEGSFVYRSF